MFTDKEIEESIRLKKYPFQNNKNVDLPGEIWKIIPDSNDEYILSNYGRCKSLAREIMRSDGFICRLPEHLKKSLVHRSKKKGLLTLGSTYFSVVSSVNLNNKKYTFVVARYLYYLFIEKYDITDFNLKISYKDENTLNLSLDNLMLVTKSHVISKAYADGAKERKYCNRSAQKIVQLTLDGQFIAEFPSIHTAAIATGIDSASIYRTVSNEYKQYKGFLFKKKE